MDQLATGPQIFEELSAIIKDLGGALLSHFRASRTGHLGESSLKIRGSPEVIFAPILRMFIFPRSQAPRCSDMQSKSI